MLESRGPGYANFGWLRVKVAGAEVKDWIEVAAKLGFKDPLSADLGNVHRDERLAPGAKQPMFWLRTREGMLYFQKVQRQVEIEYCYCSLVSACWIGSTKENKQRQIAEACDAKTEWVGRVDPKYIAP